MPDVESMAQRQYTARPDTLDFRDRMYEPTLVEVPSQRPLADYKTAQIPILNQGKEGACTGFALATVVHYLLRTRKITPVREDVSGTMLYQLARRYDEWPGENYEGSSARGAIKGWQKHGACSDKVWNRVQRLNYEVLQDATARPLGSYFRVNHKDLVAMHCAISEVGILYATATVHQGWETIGSNGKITKSDKILGGHAFAIVGYDAEGFWIQNSWGPTWGKGGFGHITYEDWLINGTDVWVARLAVPITVAKSAVGKASSISSSVRINAELRNKLNNHIVLIGNDGKLDSSGEFGNTQEDIRDLFAANGPFASRTQTWRKKRIVLYAHGGLVPAKSVTDKLAKYRQSLLDAEIFPIFFVWQSDFFSTIANIFSDFLRNQPSGGILDSVGDFLSDRVDSALELFARKPGKAMWSEMKENAVKASDDGNGAFLLAKYLGQYCNDNPEIAEDIEINIVGHSAGSIFHAPLLQALQTNGIREIKSCTLWAPACTMQVFEKFYKPKIENNYINRFALFTLTDKAEQDDNCGGVYRKSLLYLVSNSFDDKLRNPFSTKKYGMPILGMASCINDNSSIKALIDSGKVAWIQSPVAPISESTSHGGFDDDEATLKTTGSFF